MKRHNTVPLLVLALLAAMSCRTPSAGIGAGSTSAKAATDLPADLYRASDSVAVITAARALMESDQNAALTSVDAAGQPRVRTVNARLTDVDPTDPRKTMTVWVLTRASTRKVDQLRGHPKVTLYFNDDAKAMYLSIMGSAVLYDDPADPRLKRFLDDETRKFFWPDFPRDFLVIEVRPRWLEFLGPTVPGHKERWTPQAVVFTRE